MVVIREEEINKIRQSVNIVDIIKSYIPVTLKGKDYKCVCPFHDDHSPSMSISTSKQIYKCFSCGAAGNVFTFVQNYENVSFIEAVKLVASKAGIHLDIPIETRQPSKYDKEYALFELINKYFENNINTKNGMLAKDYLIKRGLSDDNIKEFRIGVCSDDVDTLTNFLIKKGYTKELLISLGITGLNDDKVYDVFRGRITFPLQDENNNILGYSARIYREEKLAKYINTKDTPIFIKGNFLYNYNRAKDASKRSGYILIVEGQMDCIRVYINGIKNVIALMGTALTNNQINMLKKLRCKVILGLDGDEAGKTATLKNGNLLTLSGMEVKVVRITSAKDPDEYILKYGINSYKECIDNAIDFFEFKLNDLKDIKNSDSTEFASLINSLLKDIGSYKDPLLREVYLQKLSSISDISIDVLKSRINEITELKSISEETFTKNVKEKENVIDKITEKILYYMMNDYKYINIYQEEIGVFNNKKYREIANEIVYFYEKNGIINIADFISYIEEKNNSDLVLKIASDKEEINDNNFSLVIKSYKKVKAKEDITLLQEKLRSELDYETQITIVNKIKEIKKGSVL